MSNVGSSKNHASQYNWNATHVVVTSFAFRLPHFLAVTMESSLSPYQEIIENMLRHGHSDEQISSHLQFECGLTKGFSKANLRRFCAQNGIGRKRIQDSKLESEIAKAIKEVSNIFHYISMADNCSVHEGNDRVLEQRS